MADILEERLRGKNGEMIERDTIEYLFSKLESNISNGTFSAIFCKNDDKPVISKKRCQKSYQRYFRRSELHRIR